ncbi:MAG TPA: BtpA/SgcQ family protein [Thermotogota bacterium]|nr:BtpA/SgcQ family protein [Thermotogota bacterium]HPJ88056.1 BtpA/SgcQ family protein [Thermotogota bacterium]HPR96241.1 BtpA/SgcQ family protein [Thermotogota bacterium]
MIKDNHLTDIFDNEKPIIAMIHLRPLPGAPLYDPVKMDFARVIDIALEEAEIFKRAGIDGLQVENIWDYPYLPGEKIGLETASCLAVAAKAVKEATGLPVGINCHLNGGEAALAAASASDADWIRVFEWVNAYVSHAGITEGIGASLARKRSALRNEKCAFFCDVHVKHGSHFIVSDRKIEEMAFDAESEGAEVLICTGFETGIAPTPERIKALVGSTSLPVILGSGVKKSNARELLGISDGAIVGSYFKKDGNWKNEVEEERVRQFMECVYELREAVQ